eukprot:1574287-Alexandrium_andersonii.AAC.1
MEDLRGQPTRASQGQQGLFQASQGQLWPARASHGHLGRTGSAREVLPPPPPAPLAPQERL